MKTKKVLDTRWNKGNTPIYNYSFNIVGADCGKNAEEAWQDFIENFIQDPGTTPTGKDVKKGDRVL